GPLTYSYSYTYTGYTPPIPPYNYTYNYPGVTAYQAGRAHGKLAVYVSPTDPTIDDSVDAQVSYLANTDVMSYYGMSLSKITDGTSNTIMLAEGYSKAVYTYKYSTTITSNPPYTYSYT